MENDALKEGIATTMFLYLVFYFINILFFVQMLLLEMQFWNFVFDQFEIRISLVFRSASESTSEQISLLSFT